MKNTLHYLQRYRKGKKFKLKDMARLIGTNSVNLSRVETGERKPSLMVMIAYHIILQIPLEHLFKKHYASTLKTCIQNAEHYKEEIIDQLESPDFPPIVLLLDELIDRLTKLEKYYEHSA